MAVRRRPQRRSREETRQRLVAAGKSLFALYGFQGASTADIAQGAGVSVAMINHHFGGKLGLYRECLKGFGGKRLQSLDRYLAPIGSATELEVRLELLVSDLLEQHLAELDVVTIILRDINIPEQLGSEVETTFFAFTLKLASFFQLGKDAGLLREELDPVVPASALYLSLSALLQVEGHRERVTGQSLKDPERRRAVVRSLIDLVLRGSLRPDANILVKKTQ